jgi:tetratricopeptide (TPR) repeat protein
MMKKIVRLLIVTSGTFTFLTNIISGVSLAEETKSAEFNFKKYDFWVDKCQLLREDKQYGEALNACEQAISLKPKKDNIQLWLARGDALLQLGQYSEAAISYDWVLQEDKKNIPALVQKCSALLGLGKHKDALKSCDLALERTENKENWDNLQQVKNYWGDITLAKALYISGSVLRRQEKYEKATTYFDNALQQDNNFALAYAGKCGVLADQKEYEQAKEICEKAVKKFNNPQTKDESTDEQTDESVKKTINSADASDAIIWYETGRVKQKLNEQQEALNNFNIAIQVNPRYSQALARKSEILNKMGRYQEALDNCDRALKGDKQWSDTKGLAYVWYQHSAALLGLQKYEEALVSAENAIAVEPKYAEAWNNKAVSLWKLGQHEDAEIAIKEAVLNYTGSYYAQGYANRGRILSSLNKYDEAILAYEYASQNIEDLDRKSLHAFWLNKAVAQMQSKDINEPKRYQNALFSIGKSITFQPSFAAFYNKAIILSRLGDYQDAIEAFDKANEFLPDNYLVLTGKAIALINVGELENYEDAQKTFQNALNTIDRALAVNPSYPFAIQKRKELIGKMREKIEKYMKVRNNLE